jgi:hypothetical protein
MPSSRREPRHVDVDAARPRLVDHVEHQDHRQPELGELRGQHQRAAQVARVGDLDDQLGAALLQQIARDLLVLAERPFERVHPGVSTMSQTSAPTVARPRVIATVVPGIVRDRDVAAGQPAEDDALADVGIADQRDAQRVRAQP